MWQSRSNENNKSWFSASKQSVRNCTLQLRLMKNEVYFLFWLCGNIGCSSESIRIRGGEWLLRLGLNTFKTPWACNKKHFKVWKFANNQEVSLKLINHCQDYTFAKMDCVQLELIRTSALSCPLYKATQNLALQQILLADITQDVHQDQQRAVITLYPEWV